MEDEDPDEAQELLNILIRKVTVGPTSALTHYETSPSPAGQPEEVQQDVIELDTDSTI